MHSLPICASQRLAVATAFKRSSLHPFQNVKTWSTSIDVDHSFSNRFPSDASPRRIFLKGFPFRADLDAVRKIAEEAGTVEDLHVFMDAFGRSKGGPQSVESFAYGSQVAH